ncbi:hypothetical protein ACOME3_004054 [Neoechinorhynchus agilis]
MSSCVFYKFRSDLNYESLTFEGISMTVGEFKNTLMKKIGMLKHASDFELVLTDAQTNEVYKYGNQKIPKNSCIILARVPSYGASHLPMNCEEENGPGVAEILAAAIKDPYELKRIQEPPPKRVIIKRPRFVPLAGLHFIKCKICNKLMLDPVQTHCCHANYCDSCLERLENCPVCGKEEMGPFIPNQFLRLKIKNLYAILEDKEGNKQLLKKIDPILEKLLEDEKSFKCVFKANLSVVLNEIEIPVGKNRKRSRPPLLSEEEFNVIKRTKCELQWKVNDHLQWML